MNRSALTPLTEPFWYVTGIAFLALAKAKHALHGYSTPKPFGLDDTARCIEYDQKIAARILEHVRSLANMDVRGKRILELGPGSDLGIGLMLIAQGASRYVAFDRHNLAGNTPTSFYESLSRVTDVDLAALHDGRMEYVVREDFDVAAGVTDEFDLIISNAAFEHFSDVETVVSRITKVAAPEAVVIAEVDLQTHSRWIRDADPNNIYRYPDWLYHTFSFPGQPNRVRPGTYRQMFAAHNWERIDLLPANRLPNTLRERRVHRQFRDQQIDWLSFIICAKRGLAHR